MFVRGVVAFVAGIGDNERQVDADLVFDPGSTVSRV
jgi:hypothetical protein